MRTSILLLATVLLVGGPVSAQSKSEMQASIAKLTAQNDSLVKVSQQYGKLIDTLSVMTGVRVNDLDTVKTVLQLRAAARTSSADSLTRLNASHARMQIQLDSLTGVVARMRTDSTAMAAQLMAAVAAQSPGAAAPAMGTTDQLMKLNSMLDQGLISKEEFLKLKAELMGK